MLRDRRRSGQSARWSPEPETRARPAGRTPATARDAVAPAVVVRPSRDRSARDDGHHAHGSRGSHLGRRESRSGYRPCVAVRVSPGNDGVRAEATVLARALTPLRKRATCAERNRDDAQRICLWGKVEVCGTRYERARDDAFL